MRKGLEKNLANILLFFIALILPLLVLYPVIFGYAGRIFGSVSQPILHPWSDAFVLCYIFLSTVFNGWGLVRILKDKSLPKYIPIITIIIVVMWAYGFIPLKVSRPMCDEKDEAVVETAQSLQEYYLRWNNFPNDNYYDTEGADSITGPFLVGLARLYNIDYYSKADPDEIFVYYKNNCKLQVKPNEYFVYPRY